MAVLPPYFLSAHSYCCELEDGAIILELVTGAYVGVHAEHLADLRICVRNWPNSREADPDVTPEICAASERLIGALLARGILTTSPTSRRSSHIPVPSAALTIN